MYNISYKFEQNNTTKDKFIYKMLLFFTNNRSNLKISSTKHDFCWIILTNLQLISP